MNLQVSFNFTFEDWKAFQSYYTQHDSNHRLGRIVITFIVPVLLLGKIQQDAGQHDLLLGQTILFVTFCLLWVFLFWRLRIGQRFSMWTWGRRLFNGGMDKLLFGTHEIELTDEYCVQRTPGGETKFFWETFKKIAETDKYAFLYIANVSAICIPKQKIEPESARDEFLSYVRSRIPVRDN